MKQLEIRPLEASDAEKFIAFSDSVIGGGYYRLKDFQNYYDLSRHKGHNASFLLVNGDQVLGLRITLAPGQWVHQTKTSDPKEWPYPPDEMGYFKSLFIDPSVQGQGWGKKLSLASLRALQKQGAKAVMTHSWVESPGNSSFKYLSKMGFKSFKKIEKYWAEIDYDCIRCKKPPCQCDALEMIYEIK